MKFDHEEVLRYLEAGHSIKEAAEFFGLPERTIRKKRDSGLKARARAIVAAEEAVVAERAAAQVAQAAREAPEVAAALDAAIRLTPVEVQPTDADRIGPDGRRLWQVQEDDGTVLLDSRDASVVPRVVHPHVPTPWPGDPEAALLRARIYETYRPRSWRERLAARWSDLLG
jgi:hypothetical protein